MNRESPSLDFSFVLASSVHDMKNSLSMLLTTLTDVIAQYPPQDVNQANAYAVLEYEAARINSELIQLLSIYRLENDQIHAHIDEHLVGDILAEQVARNYELFKSRNLVLEIACDDGLIGYFDGDLVGGVINNVLVNCSRYSSQRVRLAAAQTPDGLCISIEDDGAGYPAEMLEASTFTESRAHFAEGRPHLGLIFANKIALMHQNKGRLGFISLSNRSTLGGGCFKVYLP